MLTKPRHLLWTTAAAVSLAVAGLIGAGIVQSRADSAWQRMASRADELRRDFAAGAPRRTPLWAEAIDGNAFEHYVAGGAAIVALGIDSGDTVQLLLGATDEQLARAEQRPGWQAALVELRAGAHARDLTPPTGELDQPWVANLLAVRGLANAAAFESRALRHEGHGAEAVRVSLDAMTMAADFVHEGLLINQMIGAALLQITITAWPDEALRQLDPTARATFADGLRRLDESLPASLQCAREAFFMVDMMRGVTDLGGDWATAPGLRYGFSSRWMFADAWLSFADLLDDMAAITEAPWPNRRAAWQSGTQAMLATGNDVASIICPNFGAAEQSLRATLTELRLLRMALALRDEASVVPLADPLGEGALQIERDGATTTVRSVGDERGERVRQVLP